MRWKAAPDLGIVYDVPSSNRRPLWLLDVDGVLNAVTRRPDLSVWSDWQHGTAVADGRAWSIWFSPTVTGAVRRLHESGRAEVRWLSTWGRHANESLRALLDLPELAVAADPHEEPADPSPAAVLQAVTGGHASHGAFTGTSRESWWKLDAVRRIVAAEPSRPVLWTDDDLRFNPDATHWAATHISDRLLLAPQSQLGITPDLLRRIYEFCGEPNP